MLLDVNFIWCSIDKTVLAQLQAKHTHVMLYIASWLSICHQLVGYLIGVVGMKNELANGCIFKVPIFA